MVHQKTDEPWAKDAIFLKSNGKGENLFRLAVDLLQSCDHGGHVFHVHHDGALATMALFADLHEEAVGALLEVDVEGAEFGLDRLGKDFFRKLPTRRRSIGSVETCRCGLDWCLGIQGGRVVIKLVAVVCHKDKKY